MILCIENVLMVDPVLYKFLTRSGQIVNLACTFGFTLSYFTSSRNRVADRRLRSGIDRCLPALARMTVGDLPLNFQRLRRVESSSWA